jgi:hypothetical protein
MVNSTSSSRKRFLFLTLLAFCLTGACSAQSGFPNPINKFPDKGTWTLTNPDILRITVASFGQIIATHKDPVSKFVWDNMDDERKSFLEKYRTERFSATGTPLGPRLDGQFVTNMMLDLNALITGPLIYAKERFSSITLEPDTLQLLDQHPTNNALAHLNRMLLEDAFKSYVAKSIRITTEPAGNGFALLDYRNKRITLYDKQGERLSSTDVADGVFRHLGAFSNFGDTNPQLWFAYSKSGDGKASAGIGRSFGDVDIKTGTFTFQGNN